MATDDDLQLLLFVSEVAFESVNRADLQTAR